MFAEKIRELRPDEELIDDIADYFKVKRSELIGA